MARISRKVWSSSADGHGFLKPVGGLPMWCAFASVSYGLCGSLGVTLIPGGDILFKCKAVPRCFELSTSENAICGHVDNAHYSV